MMVVEWVAWIAIVIGLLLAGMGVRATFYFSHAQRVVNSWVLQAIYRTVATITAVALGLTLLRMIQLTFDTPMWTLPVSGGLAVWLLLIPYLLMRGFQRHEGAPLDRDETVIQRQDREVGDERRVRQAEDET